MRMIVTDKGKVLMVGKLMDLAHCHRPAKRVTVLVDEYQFLPIITVECEV